MMKLTLCSYNSLIHGLMRVRVTGVEPPITPFVFGLCFSPLVEPSPIPAVLAKTQAGAPPIIQQSLQVCLIMGTNLDYEN